MNKWLLAAVTSGGLVAADQVTKWVAWHHLAPVRQTPVIPGFFDLTFVLNTGVAFGMLSGERSVYRIAALVAFALLALVLIAFFIRAAKPHEKLLVLSLSLIAGGAVGNVIDRVRLGAVIDFLDVYVAGYHWPTFNVADIGITVGTGLTLIYIWRAK